MRILKNILLYVFISTMILLGGEFLESNFLELFLKKDLLTIIIALFGLNLTVLSILVSKLSTLKSDLPEIDIEEMTKEMKFSLIEFFVILILAGVVSILSASKILDFNLKHLVFNSILLSTLIYSLTVVWDTG